VSESKPVLHGVSLMNDEDVHLLKEGRHCRLFDKLGAHPMEAAGQPGVLFAALFPAAEAVSVVGDFNDWDPAAHPLLPRADGSGVWEGFVPDLGRGAAYQYHVVSREGSFTARKADPFARMAGEPPGSASVVWTREHVFSDQEWMDSRTRRQGPRDPLAALEVHLGSWQRVPEEDNRCLTYDELAWRLGNYLEETGFTHVEFLPVMEHPADASWGFEITSFFAPTRRHGDPDGFLRLVDALHGRGRGVILDWVCSRFSTAAFGLGLLDGTACFEARAMADSLDEFEVSAASFGLDKPFVRSFLLSSAVFWLDVCHADGLRLDGLDLMLERADGDLDQGAVEFLQLLNETVRRECPGAVMIAEAAGTGPAAGVRATRGGLGFDMRFDRGFAYDVLAYLATDPLHRKNQHDRLTFNLTYAFNENCLLPLSHDDCLEAPLAGRMFGDEWQKLANLRLLYGFQYGRPGKKLLFMGQEFGQWSPWSPRQSLDWHLLQNPAHQGVKRWVEDLNRFYRDCEALHYLDFEPEGFFWIDCMDVEQSVISFARRGHKDELVLAVVNATPVPRRNYRVGAPVGGNWREVLNSDAKIYGGSGWGNMGGLPARPVPAHGREHSLSLTLPPLGVVFLAPEYGG
jgi:1,4-alpha-glucan branching enzyme